MPKCNFHPEKEATHTDSVVDLQYSGPGYAWQHEIHYKRVPICLGCSIERKAVNTSRVEELQEIHCE